MTSAQPKTGMPKWLKIILIVGGVLVVITIGVIAAICFTGVSMYKDAQDPAKIKQVVSTFMTTRDPLPEGFEYKFGIDLFGTKMVGIDNAPKDLHFVIGDFKQGQMEDLNDPEKAINKLMAAHSSGANSGGHTKFESEKKGTETVGGRKMTYAIGKTTNEKTEKTNQVFIGLFEPTDKGTVALFGMTEKDAYDMEDTEAFLKGIEKI